MGLLYEDAKEFIDFVVETAEHTDETEELIDALAGIHGVHDAILVADPDDNITPKVLRQANKVIEILYRKLYEKPEGTVCH